MELYDALSKGTVCIALLASAFAAPTMAQSAAPIGDTETASAVAVIVKVPKPWYAPKWLIVRRMRDTIPRYEALPGLAYKAFSLTQADGQFGGIYLWKDSASAKAWFTKAWFERVEKERGAKPDVHSFEVPVAIDNTPGGTPADNDSDTVATLVTMTKSAGLDRLGLVADFTASIPTDKAVPGLLRKYFIIADDGKFGGIYLWKDEVSAQHWLNDGWKQRLHTRYGSEATIEWFETPILLPTKVGTNRVAITGL